MPEPFRKITCYKPTSEDWHPNFPGSLVRVTFSGPCPAGDDYKWLVNVWGNDDFGMDLFHEDKELIHRTFLAIIELPNVTRQSLKELGLAYC